MREAIDGTWTADNLDDCQKACADKPSCKRIVFWAKNKGCGLYTTCEPKKCGKKWRQRLKPAVYEIERPKSAAELKAAGRSAAELKAMGFSAAELNAAGIFTTKSELRLSLIHISEPTRPY